MKIAQLLAGAGFVLTSLTVSAASAQAFSFTSNLGPGSNAPKGDVWLDSVTFSGETFNNFSLVSAATIVYNDLWTGGNKGAASSDKGDKATSGIKLEAATNASVVTSLGNLNLNSIIDGEDNGTFTINLTFDNPVSNLFFWERGKNSRLGVQALDSSGSLIGNLLVLDSKNWDNAGFSIDTTEIGGSQVVGSKGISLADFGLTGPISSIQVTSKSNYNGPDFKVIGGAAAVPEPTTMLGLGLAGAGLAAARRRRANAKQS